MVSQHDVKCLYKSFEVVCSLYHKQIGCLAADKTLSAEAERYYKKKKTRYQEIFLLLRQSNSSNRDHHLLTT